MTIPSILLNKKNDDSEVPEVEAKVDDVSTIAAQKTTDADGSRVKLPRTLW
jgi:hypothetical protein